MKKIEQHSTEKAVICNVCNSIIDEGLYYENKETGYIRCKQCRKIWEESQEFENSFEYITLAE